MKGVILAGGLGARLKPLTNPLNKHLLPVYDKPMIMHVIATLVEGGIEDIMVLLNGYDPGPFLTMLEDGSELGCHLTYRFAKNINGPGRTLMMAEKFIGNEDFVLILGDSLFLTPLIFSGKPAPHMFVMPLNELDDSRKYGQVTVEKDKVDTIIWKPENLFSNLIQTTCFILPSDVFVRAKQLDKIRGNELSVTSLTSQYVREGVMGYTMLPDNSYIDCGSIQALHRAAELVFKRSKK